MSNKEKTLSIIKPDAVDRNLTEEIKSIFEKNKLQIKDSKKISFGRVLYALGIPHVGKTASETIAKHS